MALRSIDVVREFVRYMKDEKNVSTRAAILTAVYNTTAEEILKRLADIFVYKISCRNVFE